MLMTIKRNARLWWRTYGTLNNVVLVAALVVAASWVWGSISTMQTNFEAQKSVEAQKKQAELTKLQVETLKYQNNYYKSSEYQDLVARTNLGLASVGEKLMILPPNSASVRQADKDEEAKAKATTHVEKPGTNVDQWLAFLSGQSAKMLHN